MDNAVTLREQIIGKLRDAIARRYGAAARVENIVVATLGGSNRTLLFDLVEGAASRRLVFRQETYSLPQSPFIAPHLQFQLLELVHAEGLPVPAPIFELDAADGLERAYVVA